MQFGTGNYVYPSLTTILLEFLIVGIDDLSRYANLNLDEVQGLREVEAEFYSFFNGQFHRNIIWTGCV